ncbi:MULTISPECIES: flagellar transcriptional regulator FlhD [Tatumella]|uniref:Flagellar transcriptional regulator FlhD n=1 Tax=Tatumella punctata TaxID=399969 RepID=A0ABW1VJ56_9GAMM|nr:MULTISPECIES: flagellar transcriptional regulator FlhD [unclassified Tatumella]MBS0877202.1 flagellar transcriptional regulator FlhD [Tatumella sp. JGM82]MBS0889429.1 flagellar transcriptional regulator FlhD [Tatumella sp. JGM94]MBS0895058.1 flagellar transcriptional regulator FlhD [Tatumella sp. JGM130]MBS0901599.1 flagellar transcriptional regulator FlhD [Tatumella sp. JGM100]
MNTTNLVKHIYDVNLSYLLLAQQLISQDKSSAMFRLGVDESMANKLAELTLPELVKLAETNQLICKLRFIDYTIIQQLTRESRVDDMQQIHTGIMLASELLQSVS